MYKYLYRWLFGILYCFSTCPCNSWYWLLLFLLIGLYMLNECRFGVACCSRVWPLEVRAEHYMTLNWHKSKSSASGLISTAALVIIDHIQS